MAAGGSSTMPSLVVFDLDFTLWPFWLDTHITPPLSRNGDGRVYDGSKQRVSWYEEVPQVLQKLQSDGVLMAVASRTSCIEDANKLLELFDWNKYFTYKEIYPGCKVTHFKRFKTLSDIPYSRMIFFDDERRNIDDISKLALVTRVANLLLIFCIHLRHTVLLTMDVLWLWQRADKSRSTVTPKTKQSHPLAR